MRFERCGDEDDLPAHRVGRHAPFHRFFDIGQDGVDPLAHVGEDRARERLRLGYVSVDTRVAAHRIPPPIINRTTPTTITNRLRFRPLVLRETMPTPAPMTASGTISQFAQPSSGKKAITARISATKPMMSEAILNMAARLASFG